jgi:hypothetical protein
LTPAVIVRERPRPQSARSARRQQALHVIGEDIFRGVVIRERKRADRSNEGFALLVVDMPSDGRASWRHALQALAAVKRDTDIIGWLRRDRALALMMPRTIVASDAARGALE